MEFDPGSIVEKVVVTIGAVAGGLAFFRQKKGQSDTDRSVEVAKQASAQVYIDQLAATQRDLERERVQRAADNDASRARESELREINDAVRGQFTKALDKFRAEQAISADRIGTLIEDVAEWRGKAEALQAEKIDLQAAIQNQRSASNEEKRALTAGYERTAATLRSEIANLEQRNRVLVNQLYGDGTATNIMGPSE